MRMGEKRKIFAILSLDENAFDITATGDIEYVEDKINSQSIRESGIALDYAKIGDDDDEDIFAAYRNYLAEWALRGYEKPNTSPLPFEEWEKNRTNRHAPLLSGDELDFLEFLLQEHMRTAESGEGSLWKDAPNGDAEIGEQILSKLRAQANGEREG